MADTGIKVYCRVKPVIGAATLFEYNVQNDEASFQPGSIEMFIPKNLNLKNTNNKASSYKFVFNQVFDQNAEQEKVFQEVAQPVIDNAFQGYNGTVFVYGQTATGKTYTILGEQAANKELNISQKKYANQRRKTLQKRPFTVLEKSRISPDEEQDLRSSIPSTNNSPLKMEDGQKLNGPINATLNDEMNLRTKQADELPKSPISNTDGIVPRTLKEIFKKLSIYETESQVEVSYYEIYKENGYDLLSGYITNKTVDKFKNLARVKAMTDGKHNLHLKNLSKHLVKDQQEALELLEHGNTNRQVAETHLNEASSRSHCIFTIYLTIKQPETDSILKPKMHLVDLAGSERIGKSHETNEKVMAEGKNINLSLHHLQRVIVALTRRSEAKEHNKHVHIPYRNSTMTLVLKDSLGGNSYTSMIATISVWKNNLEESLSTCRFAQEVASITNKVAINEIQDSDRIIARLKEELRQMQLELSRAVTAQDSEKSLPLEESELLRLVQEYLKNQSENAFLDVGNDSDNIQFCFRELKQLLLEKMEENRLLQEKVQQSKCCVIS